jgi:hypothetical protein
MTIHTCLHAIYELTILEDTMKKTTQVSNLHTFTQTKLSGLIHSFLFRPQRDRER